MTVVVGVAILALVWGANRYLSDSTAAETGWPVIVGIAVLPVGSIVVGRHLVARSAEGLAILGRNQNSRDWNSRK